MSTTLTLVDLPLFVNELEKRNFPAALLTLGFFTDPPQAGSAAGWIHVQGRTLAFLFAFAFSLETLPLVECGRMRVKNGSLQEKM